MSSTDQNRDDYVERLKADLAAKTSEAASVSARMAVFEAKERARIAGWQPEAESFMCDWINKEVAEHHPQLSDDVAPFTSEKGWAKTYTEKPDIVTQAPLAAMSYVASKGVKRLLDRASAGDAAQATLAETMKQNEDLTARMTKLQKECDDYKALSDERQKGLETLHAELIRGGLRAEQFDFSKLTSREKVAEPHEAGAASGTPSLEVVKAEASKAASAAATANPIQQEDLLTGLLARSGPGSLRMGNNPSSNHALLGASGEADLASILRGAPGM